MSYPQPVFGYKSIEILRGEGDSLGIGSYGAVYKARCDDLPCAAKILHPTLFQSNDPGARRLLQRFEQECSFMNRIRHPNIVLYLGVCSDTHTGLPVLLMEMLEENLTTFLECSQQKTLPFHDQVNLCYDVALALSYLHSNDIIHCNLTSNNVLMVVSGHGKAKVADFGMSKLISSSGMSKRYPMSLTHCPGTEVYMPPEAFRGATQYTDKLDCFSFGVLVIQIITRLFPDPGERTKIVPFPGSPTGTTEVPILETECRESHIKLIDSDHPLLSIAISCINYRTEERLSTQEICGQIVAIRDSPQYTESLQKFSSMPQMKQGREDQVWEPTNKRFPRTISSANLETAGRCRHMTVMLWFFRTSYTKYTLNLSSLDTYPPEFKQMVLSHLVDEEALKRLESELALNWCKSTSMLTLAPLRTRDERNSLCHAASLAMWGIHDSQHNLREGIRAVMGQKELKNRFHSVYMYKHTVTNKDTKKQLQLKRDEEWKRLADISTEQDLEEFHIFALAYCLKRPIIVYANCNDTNLHNITHHGIYLPLEQDPKYCGKNPLPLAYCDGHFSALVCTKQDVDNYIPLCDYYGRMFPVKYLLSHETSSSCLEKYLTTYNLNIGPAPKNEAQLQHFKAKGNKIACARLQLNPQNTHENIRSLVTEFIDACHKEYIQSTNK